jgi:hypothetical protein
MTRHSRRARWAIAGLLLGAGVLTAACDASDGSASGARATAPALITPPAELSVARSSSACYVRQFPASDIPAVRGYRLAATSPLPQGVTPSVKTVKFVGGGSSRLLEAELCFAADPSAAAGKVDAQLELRLFNADSERLGLNDRLQPVRTLGFTQTLQIK